MYRSIGRTLPGRVRCSDFSARGSGSVPILRIVSPFVSGLSDRFILRTKIVEMTMLRCSILIFATATYLVCTPNLFAQIGAGFPSQLNQALETEASETLEAIKAKGAESTTVRKQIRQRPWLEGPSTQAQEKTAFDPKSTESLGLSTPEQKTSKFDPESVKGTPFEPTPHYMKYESKRTDADTQQTRTRPQTQPKASFAPKSSCLLYTSPSPRDRG